MGKRAILAFVLTLIVLIFYQYLLEQFMPQYIQQKKQPPQKKEEVIVAPVPSPKPSPPKRIITKVEAVAEKDIIVETDLYRAIFTNKGAAIKSWELKRYKDNSKKNPVRLLKENLDVYPLSIAIDGHGILNKNYKVDREKITLSKEKYTDTLSFIYQDPSGLSIKKNLTFYNVDYKINMTVEIGGASSFILSLGTNFGIFDAETGSISGHIGPVVRINSKNITEDLKLKENKVHTGNIHWVAIEDKYFASAIVPFKNPDNVLINKEKNGLSVGIKVSESQKTEFLLYAGPKEYDRLKALKVNLEDIIDYGWFAVLAKPLFWMLKFFNDFLKNYGLSIIALSTVIKIVFIPLTHKSQKSMKAMQELTPKINALREKYKKDTQRLNKEVMELYKKHKINPMGGCLPILLQIPVFIALYNVLINIIELRGAPFVLWIQDLSQKDPYYILPIAMGISMLIQQKMTPTPATADPIQSKIMLFLPVIFTIMFLSFPAGLVLYWLVNNILTIAQQWYTNKKLAHK
ncbi:MAG: membrane protein insertase YidC [Nitrospirota bacterium]